ncbi:MAG: hypothetical protein ACJ76Z_15405 [Thermoleophilaceae bacterium]
MPSLPAVLPGPRAAAVDTAWRALLEVGSARRATVPSGGNVPPP